MFLSQPPHDDEVGKIHDKAREEDGYVANFLQLWSWRPDIHAAFSHARRLLNTTTTLSPREIAVLNTATASRLGDAYCSIAWGSKLADLSDAPTAAAVLRRGEPLEFSARERALHDWVALVLRQPSGTTGADVDALKAAGFSEREIFDATTLIAFRVAFCTVNGALGARPDRELADEAPPEVLDSVTYGRPVAEAR
jgi:uncharacterized peroxidase-related enzyme